MAENRKDYLVQKINEHERALWILRLELDEFEAAERHEVERYLARAQRNIPCAES